MELEYVIEEATDCAVESDTSSYSFRPIDRGIRAAVSRSARRDGVGTFGLEIEDSICSIVYISIDNTLLSI